jgi:hypothetical protein
VIGVSRSPAPLAMAIPVPPPITATARTPPTIHLVVRCIDQLLSETLAGLAGVRRMAGDS